MPLMESEVVELIDDFFAGLAGEELRVLYDGGVHLLEGEATSGGAKVIEEPLPQSKVVGIEIAGTPRRLKGFRGHGL
jgi:hypothetical protein